MRICLQRVASASVTVNSEEIASIQNGLVVLLGIHANDRDVHAMCKKIASLRIFSDEMGKMNLSVKDVGGEVLIVSQFTLYADCSKGNRPSFFDAARPEKAIPVYEAFIEEMKALIGEFNVQSGRFGADMNIELINSGPVTILL